MKKLLLVISSVCFFSGALSLDEDQLWDNVLSFPKDFNEYWATGVVSDRLAQTFDLLRLRNKWKGPSRANPDFPLLDLMPFKNKEPVM